MRDAAFYIVFAAAATGAAVLWPLPSALDRSVVLNARIGASLASILICAGTILMRRLLPTPKTALVIAALAAAAGGIAAQIAGSTAAESCIATYQGADRIVGRVLQPYVKPEPGASPNDLLFDAGGRPERVWTPDSIYSCVLRTSWGAVLPIPLFAAACCFLLNARATRRTAGIPAVRVRPAPGSSPYDFFLSYRHGEPDRGYAFELLETLEKAGLQGAIDERDFQPQEHFLTEMERCIKQSRFLLCIVTGRYMDSDHCVEEAVISKTLDMGERKRRLVPLRFEDVELPVWLHGIVGIDFRGGGAADPVGRLKRLLQGT